MVTIYLDNQFISVAIKQFCAASIYMNKKFCSNIAVLNFSIVESAFIQKPVYNFIVNDFGLFLIG